MTRLITSGGEIRDTPTSDIGSPDGWSAGTVATIPDTGIFRSGQASIRCTGDDAGSSFRAWSFTAPALGAMVYTRVYFQPQMLSMSTVRVAALMTAAGGALISARLTAGGKLQLFNDVAGTQIGSDSSLTALEDAWYRLQLRVLIDTGSIDQAELLIKPDDPQIDDESISGSSLSISDTHAGRFSAGWIDAGGTGRDIFLDDVAVNDSTGTGFNSWPGEGRVAVLLPIQPSSVGVGSWTDCSGAAAPWDGMNKQPPVGQAAHITAGHTGASAHQADVRVNTVQSMQSLKLQPFAVAGLIMPVGYNASALGTSGSATLFGQLATARIKRAQNFSFGAAVAVDSAMIALGTIGSPTDDVIVELQTDASGVPSDTVLATGRVAGSSLSNAAKRVTVRFDQTVALTASQAYWIVLYRSDAFDSSNYFFWAKSGAAEVIAGIGPLVNDGAGWIASGIGWSNVEHVCLITPTAGTYPPTFATQFLCHGEGATGAKAGTLDTNVNIGAGVPMPQKTFNFGNDVGVASTYPTNWRWSIGTGGRPTGAALTSITNPAITVTKLAGSGTSPCLVCAGGLLVEFTLPPQGWGRYQKTADSTFWWAKRAANDTTYETGTGGVTIVTISAGDWAIYPSPQITEGQDFPATLTSIDDDTLNTSYTPA